LLDRSDMRATIAESFDDHWIEDPDSGCWVWQRCVVGKGYYDGKGYGALRLNGAQVRAHRFSWERTHGPIPDGLHLRHKCDNSLCVNPDHMELGTNAQNMGDKGVRDVPMKNKKLTADQVREIREYYNKGVWQKTLAKEYGVCQSYISQICSGRYRQYVR